MNLNLRLQTLVTAFAVLTLLQSERARAGLPVVVAGDYNNDGTVDAADYTVWRDNRDSPPGTLIKDPAGGFIGPAQYDAWVANFGATTARLISAAPGRWPRTRPAVSCTDCLLAPSPRSTTILGCSDRPAADRLSTNRPPE